MLRPAGVLEDMVWTIDFFYLRSCRFGISLMCQFHWELDCVGFSPFEIWRCGCVEMMRGIGGEGFFPFYGIAGVSPEYRRKFVSCLALSCLVAAAATAATAAGSAGPDAAVAAAVGAEQGDSLMRLLGTCQS